MKCDLTEADFSGIVLEGLEFEDCRFASTNFASTYDKDNQFVGCIFAKCSFYGAYIGMRARSTGEPSHYEDCVFSENDFTKALFQNAIFRRTIFDNNRMKGVDFSTSGFWDCRFVGPVEDVWFRGSHPHPDQFEAFGPPVQSGLHRVDFSAARLAMIAISDGCPLEKIKLPEDGSCLLINIKGLLADAVQFSSKFGEDQSVVAKLVGWITCYAKPNGISTPQELGILCRHDLKKFLSPFIEHSDELAAAVFEKARDLYKVGTA